MSTEETKTTEEEVSQATEQDAYEATLSGETQKEAPKKEPEEPTEPEKNDPVPKDDEQSATDQVATETPPQLVAGLKKEDLDKLLANAAMVPDLIKRNDDLNGRYGRLKQSFEELQKASTQSAPAATKQAVVTLQKLRSDGFTELADSLEADLKSVFTQPTTGLTQEQVDERISAGITDGIERFRAEQVKQHQEEAARQLAKKHPDYESVIETPDYKLWLATLPEPDRNEFVQSWDAGFVSEKLTEFKSWRDSRAKQSEHRLADAVTPSGATRSRPGSTTLSEQEAFDAELASRPRLRRA